MQEDIATHQIKTLEETDVSKRTQSLKLNKQYMKKTATPSKRTTSKERAKKCEQAKNCK